MASHLHSPHVAGHKPAVTNGGWGVALLVSALAVVLWIGAWYIHRETFFEPSDPLSPGSETPAAAGHGAVDGGHAEDAQHGGATAPAGH